MPLVFYPHQDDTKRGSFEERIEVLLEAAELYKTALSDLTAKTEAEAEEARRPTMPRELGAVHNWDEIALLLRELRELPEATRVEKNRKALLLTKLADVYEVLRAAKMSKLEAVRIALMTEASQLRDAGS